MERWDENDRKDDEWDPWPEVQLSPVGGESPNEHYPRSMGVEGVGGPNSPFISKRATLEPDLPRRLMTREGDPISKEARRKYNELEKRDLIDEDGEATNHHRLDVVGTHYETEEPEDILRSMPFSL